MSDAPHPGGPVDPRFARARDSARTRRRRHSLRRNLIIGLAGVAVAGGLVAGGLLVGPGLLSRLAGIPRAQGPVLPAPETGPQTVTPPNETARADPPPAQPSEPPAQAAPRFIDLPGEPLRIESGSSARSAPPRYLSRPDGLPPGRGEGRVLVIRDTMVPPGERLNVSLPTSQEDFAIFQAQRRTAARPEPSVAAASKPADGLRLRPRNVAEAHALIAHHAAGRQTARTTQTGPARTFGAAALRLRPPEDRAKLHEESILRIARAAPTEQILIREGLTEEDARIVARAARDHLGLDGLDGGHVIALRWQGPVAGQGARRQFAQAAFYGPDRYLGSLARGRGDEAGGQDPAGDPAGTLSVTTGADPWIDRDFSALMEGASAAQTVSQPAGGKLRIMDGLYGAALRQGLPPRLVGQMIMLLAEAHELDAEASESDRITLVLSERPPDGAGRDSDSDSEARLLDQVLFIGIEGDHKVHCYVHRPAPDGAPTCYGARDGRAPARGPAGGTAGAAASDSMIDGAGAVEKLVNRIIQVESAGKADARNPRSTATGLGQFIDRTWLRMMRTYRPDLTAQMSDAELLDLRTEPRIAREMVTNLAREGAAFLRARGHAITAGRLYLAHFLGMEGAHVALTADPDTDLAALFGAGVVSANPFLKGRDAGYVVQWAEAKMSGASGQITVIREPDGLDRFRGLVDELLGTG